MTTERFWEIIEATRAPAQEEQLERLKGELQRLSIEELIGFGKQFAQLNFAAYQWDLWAVVWLCRGGMCSDDSFEYFRYWLISQGRSLYEKALQNPDNLADELRWNENTAFELFGYVPRQSYHERTRAEFPDLGLRQPKAPSGGDWLRPELKDRTGSNMLNLCVVFREMGREEFAAIEQRFPRVWDYCLRKGIITSGKPAQEPSERIPSPEEVARSHVDPNLANTNFPAYLKALADAARKEYARRNQHQ